MKEAPAGSSAPRTFAQQATSGQALFTANCARCHGASAEGGSAPSLVGLKDGALGGFSTAEELATFIIGNMPPGGAGRLSDAEYYSIVAFDLQANGIVPAAPIDAKAAGAIALH